MILIYGKTARRRRELTDVLDGAGRAWRDVGALEDLLDVLDGPDGAAVTLTLFETDAAAEDDIAALRRFINAGRPLNVIAYGDGGSVATAVAAMKAGADDFLMTPAAPKKLLAAIDAAAGETREATSEDAGGAFASLVAESPAIRRAIEQARRIAASTIPVLIEGESGVGKEVFAQAIHAASRRAQRPFVAVNCGALPEALVESILFGHEKGAFTGAVHRRVGKFEEAHGGTLFLDEVGELPLDAQVKLLRAIQEGEVDPVGGAQTVRTDIRVISATNRRLLEEVDAGRFREDLFYRLSVFPLTLPPLRRRREDIGPLARKFAIAFAAREGKPSSGVAPAAEARLTAADWPGNIRQLENTIHRAVVLAPDGRVVDVDLPAARRTESADDDAAAAFFTPDGHIRPLSDIEGAAMDAALARYDGSMSEAARRLEIGRSTLYRRTRGDADAA